MNKKLGIVRIVYKDI